jgi:hypothetical protein
VENGQLGCDAAANRLRGPKYRRQFVVRLGLLRRPERHIPIAELCLDYPFFKHLGNPSPISHEQIARAKPIEDKNPAQTNWPQVSGVVARGRGETRPPAGEHKNVPEIDGKPNSENLHLWGHYASWNSPMCKGSPRHRRGGSRLAAFGTAQAVRKKCYNNGEHVELADEVARCEGAVAGISVRRRGRGWRGSDSINEVLSLYRSGRCADWVKVKNPDAPAAARIVEWWRLTDRGLLQTNLDLIEQQIIESEVHITRQRNIITKLEIAGLGKSETAKIARELLAGDGMMLGLSVAAVESKKGHCGIQNRPLSPAPASTMERAPLACGGGLSGGKAEFLAGLWEGKAANWGGLNDRAREGFP